MSENNLARAAMLVNLSVSQWTARKYDRRVSQEVADKYQAPSDIGRYNKSLIAREAIKKIERIVNAARSAHYELTLPWSDDGWRLLTVKAYPKYDQGIQEFERQFNDEVALFITNYPALKFEAQTLANGLYRESDYPAAASIASKFGFKVVYSPMVQADDFRLEVRGADGIRRDIKARGVQAQEGAMSDLWGRLYGAVNKMVERLSDPSNIFRDSLVENLTDLCDLLPALNFKNDSDLAALGESVRAKLTVTDPETLRTDSKKRSQVAVEAAKLLSQISGAGGRYIDLSD